MTIFVIAGPPFSKKTEFGLILARLLGATHINTDKLDDVTLYGECRTLIIKIAAERRDLVITGCRALEYLFIRSVADIKIYVECPKETILISICETDGADARTYYEQCVKPARAASKATQKYADIIVPSCDNWAAHCIIPMLLNYRV